MIKTTKDQTKDINNYNTQSYDTYMTTLLGEEGYARLKPTKNLSDFLSSARNDNQIS